MYPAADGAGVRRFFGIRVGSGRELLSLSSALFVLAFLPHLFSKLLENRGHFLFGKTPRTKLRVNRSENLSEGHGLAKLLLLAKVRGIPRESANSGIVSALNPARGCHGPSLPLADS